MPAGHLASPPLDQRERAGGRGAQLVPFTAPARTGTRFRTAGHHGVLRVRLDPGRWVSEFDTVEGTVLDRASAGC